MLSIPFCRLSRTNSKLERTSTPAHRLTIWTVVSRRDRSKSQKLIWRSGGGVGNEMEKEEGEKEEGEEEEAETWRRRRKGERDQHMKTTSTSHNALELVAAVAEVLPVVRRKTYCCFLYSSPVRNFSCSAWNRRTTSPCHEISWQNKYHSIFKLYIIK